MTASHLFQSNCLSPRIHLISLSSRVGASEISIIITENGHCHFSNFPAKDRHPSHFSNLSCQGWTPVSLLQFCLSKTDTHLISPTSYQGQTPSHFSNSPWHRWTPISLLQLSLSRTDTHLTSSVKVKYPYHFCQGQAPISLLQLLLLQIPPPLISFVPLPLPRTGTHLTSPTSPMDRLRYLSHFSNFPCQGQIEIPI